MKKETKMYWEALGSTVWGPIKETCQFVFWLSLVASWLPAFIWWTGFFDESTKIDKYFGTILWAVGSVVITGVVMVVGSDWWKAIVKFNNGVKRKAKAKAKKEQTVINRKLRKEGEREAKRIQRMQDESDRTGKLLMMADATMIDIRPRTTKAQRVIMQTNNIKTYEAL